MTTTVLERVAERANRIEGNGRVWDGKCSNFKVWDKFWYVFYVESGLECEFAKWVANKGGEAYAPLELVQLKPRHKKAPVDAERPVYPNYVFVREGFESKFADLMQAEGFLRIVMFDMVYARVQDKVVRCLMEMQAEGLFDHRPLSATGIGLDHIRIGQRVSVIDGPFVGYVGQIVGPRDRHRPRSNLVTAPKAEIDFGFAFGTIKISVTSLQLV